MQGRSGKGDGLYAHFYGGGAIRVRDGMAMPVRD